MIIAKIRYPFRLALILLMAPSLGWSSNDSINVSQKGVAIHGYDPVSYFVAGKPEKGKAHISYKWSGATWLFSSETNRSIFVGDPEKYAPQFGGFCAYAASYGQFADTDPDAWSIVNGKLYLNFSLRVREIWRPRAEEFIGDARQLWPTMTPREAASGE
jgi:YHS domain-containing protein